MCHYVNVITNCTQSSRQIWRKTVNLRIILSLAILIASVSIAHAAKRVALVIGNSDYESISRLSNPKNDALLIASTLNEVGFEVVAAIDVDRREMGRAVKKFGRALRRAGKDAVGLFYFAGHGIQAQGVNYLIPLAAQIDDEADLDLEAISASDVLRQMETAGNGLNIVILDACRNNPLKGVTRSDRRGLARITAVSGSLIAFSAAPGQVAFDGRGGNSPFTTALAETILLPGLAVEHVFKRVRVVVEEVTGGAQTPWEESSLRGDFYFVPEATNGKETLVAKSEKPKKLELAALAPTTSEDLLSQSTQRAATNESFALEEPVDQPAKSTQHAALTEGSAPETASQMTALGRRYEIGDDVVQSYLKAAHWYREAANRGHAAAKYRLGTLYYRGLGVGRSWTEASIHILDAVALNHEPAIEALTRTDTRTDPDFLKAVQQRLKALGLYRARIDGKWGPGSRNAVLAHAGRITEPETASPTTKQKSRAKTKLKKRQKPRKKQSSKTVGTGCGKCWRQNDLKLRRVCGYQYRTLKANNQCQ